MIPVSLMLSARDIKKITQKAYQLRFDKVGFTSQFAPTHAPYFTQWLQQGKNAGMAWLAENQDKRLKPQNLASDCVSIIVLSTSYYHERDQEKDFSVAKYAHGQDYHVWVKKNLEELATFIKENVAPDFRWRSFVDTGPILERDLAAKAGLGWVGKNTCLIDAELGSFVFLSVILGNLSIPESKPVPDQCGSCSLCLDACPTVALSPYQLDAGKCLAYHNIEKRGEREKAYWPKLGSQLVGCDICQDVCPWNHHPPETRQTEWLAGMDETKINSLEELLEMDELAYKNKFSQTAISRIKCADFMRNVFLVIANLKKRELAKRVQVWIDRHPQCHLAEASYCLEKISDSERQTAAALTLGKGVFDDVA